MTLPADDFTTDADRWSYRTGARWAEPYEWSEKSPDHIPDHQSHLEPLQHGLVLAADDDGLILAFRPDGFREGSLAEALNQIDEAWEWPLTPDEFMALPLTELMFELVKAGLLAMRNSGDLLDYRLTLPASAGPKVCRHRVKIDPPDAIELTFEGVPPDDDRSWGVFPRIRFDFQSANDGSGLVVFYRAFLSDKEAGDLIEALSQAREDARWLAGREGWQAPRGDMGDVGEFGWESPPF